MHEDGPAPRETAERFCYEVPSDRNPRVVYRVDLTAEGGYGRCSCTDWNTRRWPAIKEGKPMGTRETLCKHGMKARRHFLNKLLARLAQEEKET
jgi:hypothetical protein